MSKKVEVSPGASKELNTMDSNPSDLETGAEGPEDLVQDQIIIAPEIMKKILGHLDLRSLKTVRLVCKSWLQEAQFYMEQRGIVRLFTDWPPFKIQDFIDMRQEQVPVLPQPFQSLNVDFNPGNGQYGSLYKDLLPEVSSLCPPLAITRLSLTSTDMNFVLPFIVQCSSSLEYLKLSIQPLEVSYPLDPKQKFPNLRHIKTEISLPKHREDYKSNSNIPSVVAWIVEGSPNLDTYESWNNARYDAESVELASQLLLKVDIKNIKTLILPAYYINREASEHFLSIPFSQLQNFRMGNWFKTPFSWSRQALVATLLKSTNTLRTLDLSFVIGLEDDELAALGNVKCLNVQELTLLVFPYRNHFIPNHLPNLKVLNVRDLILLEEVWSSVPPLFGLQTLRILRLAMVGMDYDLKPRQPIESQFLDKFPDLERLCVEPSFLIQCCRLKASGGASSNLLQGLKHLEVGKAQITFRNPSRTPYNYSPLAVLKGIETLTLGTAGREITTVPVKYMSSLKLIQFSWALSAKGLNINKLLELARGVEKVAITNCCSIPRAGSSRSKELLELFFASAPNAECGCKEWNKLSQQSFRS